MPDSAELFDAVRTDLLRCRDALCEEIRKIEALIAEQTARLRERRERLAALQVLLGEAPEPPAADGVAGAPKAGATSPDDGDYAGLGPSDAVRRHLQRYPQQWYRPAGLYRALKKRGFRTAAQQPSSLMRSCLQRMVKAGEAEVRGEKRYRRYRMAQERQQDHQPG